MERVKDIQFSSKQRFNTQKVRELQQMRAALGWLLAKLPPELESDPGGSWPRSATIATGRSLASTTVARRKAARPRMRSFRASPSRIAGPPGWKTSEFLPPILLDATARARGIRVYHLPPVGLVDSAGSGPAALQVADTQEDKPRHRMRPRQPA
jgi:hypothetical protein